MRPFLDYQPSELPVQNVKRTLAVKAPETNIPVEARHAILGINGELYEMDLAEDAENYYEEIGDVLWYIVLLLIARGMSEEDVARFMAGARSTHTNVIRRTMGELCDWWKRNEFYAKETPLDIKNHHLAMNLFNGMQNYAHHIPLTEIFNAVILKLRIRYPDKFDMQPRDVNSEMKPFRELVEKHKVSLTGRNKHETQS